MTSMSSIDSSAPASPVGDPDRLPQGIAEPRLAQRLDRDPGQGLSQLRLLRLDATTRLHLASRCFASAAAVG